MNQVFFILTTGESSVNRQDSQAPTLAGPPQLYQGSGPPSCTVQPALPTIYEQPLKFSFCLLYYQACIPVRWSKFTTNVHTILLHQMTEMFQYCFFRLGSEEKIITL